MFNNSMQKSVLVNAEGRAAWVEQGCVCNSAGSARGCCFPACAGPAGRQQGQDRRPGQSGAVKSLKSQISSNLCPQGFFSMKHYFQKQNSEERLVYAEKCLFKRHSTPAEHVKQNTFHHKCCSGILAQPPKNTLTPPHLHTSPQYIYYNASHSKGCHRTLTRGMHKASREMNSTQIPLLRVSTTQRPGSISSLSQMFPFFRFCLEVEVIPGHILQ